MDGLNYGTVTPLNMINVPQWCLLISVAIRRDFASNILDIATF